MRHGFHARHLFNRDRGELTRQVEYEQNALGLQWLCPPVGTVYLCQRRGRKF
jgi:hypothetical protein